MKHISSSPTPPRSNATAAYVTVTLVADKARTQGAKTA